MLILTSLQALLNTLVFPKTAFNTKSRFVQTKSLSLFTTIFLIILTLALVFNITCISNLLTFTSSFSIFVAYACLVFCLRVLINLMLIVKTFAFVYASMLLKNNFTKVREYINKSCSLIVISYFITLSKTAFRFITSFITFKYYFLKVLYFLQTVLKLSFTFTKTILSIRLFSFMSLFVILVTVASF